MTVREFFTELIAQIENMKVLDFILLLALLAVAITLLAAAGPRTSVAPAYQAAE